MPGAGHHTKKWDDCVDKVKAKGTGNAYAICTAALGKSIAAGDQVAYACGCGAELRMAAGDVASRCSECGQPVDARRLKAVEASEDGRTDETLAKPAGLSPEPKSMAPFDAGTGLADGALDVPPLYDGDAADVAVTRVTRALSYDESQHPRHPKGDPQGGEWRAAASHAHEEAAEAHERAAEANDQASRDSRLPTSPRKAVLLKRSHKIAVHASGRALVASDKANALDLRGGPLSVSKTGGPNGFPARAARASREPFYSEARDLHKEAAREHMISAESLAPRRGLSETRSLRDISAKARKQIKHFAGKGTSFPIAKPEDVTAAAKAIGRAGSGNYDAATLRRNITRIARLLGPAFVKRLPDAWTAKALGNYDESQHPRHPKGVPEGGEWRAKHEAAAKSHDQAAKDHEAAARAHRDADSEKTVASERKAANASNDAANASDDAYGESQRSRSETAERMAAKVADRSERVSESDVQAKRIAQAHDALAADHRNIARFHRVQAAQQGK